jgi:hypothetical protein
LGHLARVRPEVVEAHHSLVFLVDDELHVAGVLRPVCHGPLEGPEVGVEHLDVEVAEPGDGVLLGLELILFISFGCI